MDNKDSHNAFSRAVLENASRRYLADIATPLHTRSHGPEKREIIESKDTHNAPVNLENGPRVPGRVPQLAIAAYIRCPFARLALRFHIFSP